MTHDDILNGLFLKFSSREITDPKYKTLQEEAFNAEQKLRKTLDKDELALLENIIEALTSQA